MDGGNQIKRVSHKGYDIFINVKNQRWLCNNNSTDSIEDIYNQKTAIDFHYGDLHILNRNRNLNTITLKLTNTCNLQCIYCYNCSGRNSEEHMTYKVVNAFFEYFNQMQEFSKKSLSIIFHGGEPLLNFNLIQYFINKFNSSRYLFSIQTNGTLITTEIAKVLTKYRVGVSISLDGPNWINEIHRGNSTKTIEGIRALQENDTEILGLSCTVTKNSLSRLDEIIEFFITLNIFNYKVSSIIPMGRALCDEALTFYEEINLLRNCVNIQYSYYLQKQYISIKGVDIFISNVFTNARTYMCQNLNCGANLLMLSIDFNGDIYPCDFFIGNKKYLLGNLFQTGKPDYLIPNDLVARNMLCNSCPFFLSCFGDFSCPVERSNRKKGVSFNTYYQCPKYELICDTIVKAHTDKRFLEFVHRIIN